MLITVEGGRDVDMRGWLRPSRIMFPKIATPIVINKSLSAFCRHYGNGNVKIDTIVYYVDFKTIAILNVKINVTS
jgi:hypothetical protein